MIFFIVDEVEYNISLKIFENIMLLKDVASRKVYDTFVVSLPNLYHLRIQDGQNDFDFSKEEMTNIFIRPRITTLLTKVREFQYKLLHGAIYTKVNLLKFGFAKDDHCSFCKQNSESYLHLFWDCVHVKPLWQIVIEKLDLEELKDIEWKDIHVGITGRDLKSKICNTIIFVMKYIIFKSRPEGIIPTNKDIFQKITEYRDEEYAIAIRTHKLDKHLLKWESIEPYLMP